MGRILAAGVVLALFVAANAGGRALAQAGDDAERTAAARALFEQGMRAVDARDWETAADRLRRSLELRPSPVVGYNLALALAELGRLVEASEHLRAVQRDSPQGSDAHRLATQRLAEVLPRLGRLRIDVTGARRGVEVRLDGSPVPDAVIGVPQPADPGSHRVSLHRDADEIGASDVTVVAGELATVSLYAPPGVALWPEDVPRPGTQPAAGGVEGEWWLWTLIGAGAVVIGVAIVLAVVLTAEPPPYLNGDSGVAHPTLWELP